MDVTTRCTLSHSVNQREQQGSAPDWISTITPFVHQPRQLGNMELPNVPTTDSRCRHSVSEDEVQVRADGAFEFAFIRELTTSI